MRMPLCFALAASVSLLACAAVDIAPRSAPGGNSASPVSAHVETDRAAASPDPGSGETSVLFIGNSLTSFNDLPRMLADLAKAGGQAMAVDISSAGGGTLAGHIGSPATLAKLGMRSWRFVVLQEQSDLPASEAGRRESVYPPLRAFKDKLDEIGATPLLFMTWGRKDGLPDMGFSTYADMQAALEEGYLEMAAAFRWMVVPAGIAWRESSARRPDVALWRADGIHPTGEGTYLTACAFYAALFRRSPVGIGFLAGLPEETARYLQGIAAATVLDDLRRWMPSSE